MPKFVQSRNESKTPSTRSRSGTGSIPQFGAFSGTRVAASYSAVAALFAEYAGGSGGLAESMRNGLDTPLVGAAITLLALMSMGLFALVTLAERLALPWSRRRR